MSKDFSIEDAELQALMAELEAQNQEIAATICARAAPEIESVEQKPVAVVEEEAPREEAPREEAPHVKFPMPIIEVNSDSVAAEEQEPVVTETPPATRDESGFSKVAGLDFYVDVDQFRRDTAVSDANLDKCLIEQSGLRAYYGAQAARAEAQAGRMKARFEVLEATLYDYHRKEMAASGEKTTEKMVENAVRLDPRWLKGKNMLIEAESIAQINKAMVQSLADRRDMVIQLGADRRDEFKGAARVMAEQQERDNLRDRALAVGQRRAA